ncbi:MAG: hypothetical protein HY053_05935 [Proteobacteria bacterium]|nr:hypothetical protein [Pseudomonadota bacterium]
MEKKPEGSGEALFEQALATAEKHLTAALTEAGPLAPYVAVAMIEAAVNRGVDVAGHADIVDMLRDLAGQIEDDMEKSEG